MRWRAVLLCAPAVWGCGGDAQPESAPPPADTLGLIPVESVTAVVPMVLPAQLYVEHDAWVYARSTGIVEAVHADVGDRVPAGAVLAELENEDQVIAAEAAEARHVNALASLARFRSLAGTGAVTRADSEMAELNAREAELALRQARRDLELTRIVAPFDGLVARRRTRVGQLVEPLDTLFRVTALGPLKLSVQVPGAFLPVRPGDSAMVTAPDGQEVVAVVSRVAPTVDPASGTREVILRLPGRAGLRPGTPVEVHVGTAPRTVVAVPAALLRDGEYVLVWAHGRAALRAVTVGAPLPEGMIEIVAGLVPGERLVGVP